MRPTIVWGSVVATAAAAASVAIAAGFGVVTMRIGTGDATVVPCDTNGFTLSYTTSHGNLTAVTVGGIADPACEGGSLAVTVTGSAGASITAGGPQTIPADGDSADNAVTVSTSPQPSATQVAGYHVSITGP